MKKAYQKPELYAETFTLVEHIASCALNTGTYTAHHSNAWVCYVTDAGDTSLFTENINSCEMQIDPNLENIDEIVSALVSGQCYNSVVSGPMFSS